MWRWLVIIARDRPELWVTWAAFYGGAGRIEILFDRRQGHTGAGWRNGPDRRARLDREAELPARGFLVIPRPDLVGASR